MIDTHTHLHYSGRLPDEPAGITAEKLIETMSERSIDISVLLPMETPELTSGFCLTEWVIEAAEQFPEQLVPFMHFDPRKPRCVDLIEHFNAHPLVRGFGELVDPLPFDDPRRLKIYDKCGELGLPLVFYGDKNASVDEPGLPRLERCLRDFPDTIFIGHGSRWWNAISAEDDGECGYPGGEVVPGGPADRFLQEYENMYADISARSGYNALMRDPEFTLGFIERNWRKLFFATDYLDVDHEIGHVRWIRETPMDEKHRYAIAEGNARRVLGLGPV